MTPFCRNIDGYYLVDMYYHSVAMDNYFLKEDGVIILVDMLYSSGRNKFYVRFAYNDFCFVNYVPLKLPRHLVMKREKDVWSSVQFRSTHSVKEQVE